MTDELLYGWIIIPLLVAIILYGIGGLTPLEDQQLAGIFMWVPAGTLYAGAALFFAARLDTLIKGGTACQIKTTALRRRWGASPDPCSSG